MDWVPVRTSAHATFRDVDPVNRVVRIVVEWTDGERLVVFSRAGDPRK